MTLIYVIFMSIFVYMAYGTGVVAQNEIVTAIYTVGAFAMGCLGLVSSIQSKKINLTRFLGNKLSEMRKENNDGIINNN